MGSLKEIKYKCKNTEKDQGIEIGRKDQKKKKKEKSRKETRNEDIG